MTRERTQIRINNLKKLLEESNNVKQVTERILEIFKVEKYPVPIVEILKELDFLVGAQNLQRTLSGYIAIGKDVENKYGNDKLISINLNDSYGHQRFALAHELSHFLFDYDYDRNLKESYFKPYSTEEVDSVEERRANTFAANLLMPEDEFKDKYLNSNYKGEKLIEELTEYFGVTKTAVNKRIEELQLN